ncbi:hypothetical protein FAEPRAA2165_00302 [Faecalibacterium duncaniae]|uniref:Uncharacterized protein n=1 Tax=Faecalibacterium duncaniae (strain DSM 17677 / JCM 31915 / A2-165) TaxID=411483 RepID=C7H210_FAED2|nr:hypothetical protein FAEPRAA2165_00302 [Faecalibacterium duncaniae]
MAVASQQTRRNTGAAKLIRPFLYVLIERRNHVKEYDPIIRPL